MEILVLLMVLLVAVLAIASRALSAPSRDRSMRPISGGSEPTEAKITAEDRQMQRDNAYAESWLRQNELKESPAEIWDHTAGDPTPCSASLQVQYRDSAGNVSSRHVTVKQTDLFTKHGYFYAYCHRRRAHRTFRTDRVVEATDISTGESIPALDSFLEARYRETPDFSLHELLSTHLKSLRVLLYIPLLNEKISPGERKILRDAARSLTNDIRLKNQHIDRELEEVIEPPSKASFEKLVRDVAKESSREARATVLAASEALATIQPAALEGAEAALSYLRKYFSPREP